MLCIYCISVLILSRTDNQYGRRHISHLMTDEIGFISQPPLNGIREEGETMDRCWQNTAIWPLPKTYETTVTRRCWWTPQMCSSNFMSYTYHTKKISTFIKHVKPVLDRMPWCDLWMYRDNELKSAHPWCNVKLQSEVVTKPKQTRSEK